jgi:uncharacterized membrane protein YbaN (DUF454 family)
MFGVLGTIDIFLPVHPYHAHCESDSNTWETWITQKEIFTIWTIQVTLNN